MDGITMLRAACWLFILAAAGGLVMTGIRLGAGRNPPAWLAYAHGLLAASGLTLLIYAGLSSRFDPPVLVAMWLLIAAAAGGTVLNLVYHWKDLPLPKGLMFAHILLAVAGLGMLLFYVY